MYKETLRGIAGVGTFPVISLLLFVAVFVLNGLTHAAINVSNMNILLEFAPTAEERPTYVGLGNTLAAPFAFAAPLLAGVLADVAGFASVFVASTVAGVVCVTLLFVCVREPRHATA